MTCHCLVVTYDMSRSDCGDPPTCRRMHTTGQLLPCLGLALFPSSSAPEREIELVMRACKVRRGNLERGVTWNAALSSAYYSGTKTVRLPSWDGIRRYTSALSYRGLQVSDSSFAGSFAGILFSLCNQILQINLSDDCKLLTVAPLHIKLPSTDVR